MVKQQIITYAIGRLNYISRKDLFSDTNNSRIGYIERSDSSKEKLLEYKGGKSSHENYKYLFKCLENECRASNKPRVARELIIPIPHCLVNSVESQVKFIDKYIENFKRKYNLKNDFLYMYGIHNKEKIGKKLNLHAHFLFSERPLLEKPVFKTFNKRYFDANWKECRKDEASNFINRETRLIHFGTKYKGANTKSNNKLLFSSYRFCKEQDEIWKNTVLELGILKEYELTQVFKSKGIIKRKIKITKKHRERSNFRKGISRIKAKIKDFLISEPLLITNIHWDKEKEEKEDELDEGRIREMNR